MREILAKSDAEGSTRNSTIPRRLGGVHFRAGVTSQTRRDRHKSSACPLRRRALPWGAPPSAGAGMITKPISFVLAVLAIAVVLPPPQATAQEPAQGSASPKVLTLPKSPDGLPPGVTTQQMWPAPTAEDWKKPCLIKFQRTYEDAIAVSRETGKPILVCVNMDGEPASEHYAGVRYRQPEIAALYEPYVCVIASVYRHNPRDYDDQGRRILCPRFGSVTCGEHIAIEPGLYDKFFEGQRVAPRHIAIEPGKEAGKQEIYDVYYTWDLDTVFNSLRYGIDTRPAPPASVVRGDRSMVERVASRDNQD